MFHRSRTQLLKDALAMFLIGGLLLLIFGPFDAADAWTLALPFLLAGMGFLFWRQRKVAADHRRASRSNALPQVTPRALPPQSSPESSSFDCDFD